MSSTNRSQARKAHVSDYYITPVGAILDFLMEFDNDFPKLSFTGGDKYIIDPCAGGDANHAMSYPDALSKYKYFNHARIYTNDIRNDSKATNKGNYLNITTKNVADVIITNPPFNIAQQIITKALDDVKDDGLVIMLLRLNFFGSQSRFKFWDNNMPMVCYVHSKRMKFTDNGGTDSIEYMHAVWVKGQHNKFTQLRVI